MTLARRFAELVLCAAKPPGCGQCRDCLRIAKAEHPDLVMVGPDPELKSGQISVDQVRELAAAMPLSSHEGRGSVVVIAPAEAMTREACNALLKTLEEPRARAHLVLVTTQPARLPATIRSRCQRLRAPAPDRAMALSWLAAQRPGKDWEAALDVLGVSPLEALEHDVDELRSIRDQARVLLQEAGSGRFDVMRQADLWSKDQAPLRLRALEHALASQVLEASGRHLPEPGPPQKLAAALRLLEEIRGLQQLQATPINRTLAMERQLWRMGAAV
jgi:DNA polymerase-3 subunit delta'